MEVVIEITEGLGRRVTVQVPVTHIEEEQAKRIKKISKTAKMDGFRPGKVPLKVIEQRYGASARQEALTHIISSTLLEALTKEDLHPVAQPKIEITSSDPEKPLEYIATFEVFPKIDPVSLNDVEIEKINTEIAEEDINRTLENIRKQHTEWDVVDRPAQNGDQVIIDFEGFIDDQAFEGGKASEVPVILGSNTMIPKFEEGIIGAKAGDDFEIQAQFPETYYNKNLAGKLAKFKIKLHKVSQSNLPELNTEFIKKLGIEGDLAELKKHIRETMEKELKEILKQKNKEKLFQKLLELNKIELPKILIENEIEFLKGQAIQQMTKYTTEQGKTPDMPRELFEEQSIRRVSLWLLIQELAKLYDIKPDPNRVYVKLLDIASHYKQPDQVIAWYYQDKDRLQQIETLVTEDAVVEKLFEVANIKEKQISFEELIKLPSESEKPTSV